MDDEVRESWYRSGIDRQINIVDFPASITAKMTMVLCIKEIVPFFGVVDGQLFYNFVLHKKTKGIVNRSLRKCRNLPYEIVVNRVH